jgi:HSP20 family molecular chaperone IbpA
LVAHLLNFRPPHALCAPAPARQPAQYSSRALRFPEDADLSKVNANMEAGVLRVTIGKREGAQVKRQTIKVA